MIEDDKLQQEKKNLRKASYNRLLELYVWVFIATLAMFPVIFYSFRYRMYEDFFIKFYDQFLVGVLLILIPILFKLIFGRLPFEYLRTKKDGSEDIIIEGVKAPNIIIHHLSQEDKVEDYNLQCINESKIISEKIFARSGVYLLTGCLIAFIGVAIFYSPIFLKTTSTDISQRLLDYLPRFGALFFIEFIAFFFLKQYRIMLEEYRYYEAIKRKRQDNFNLIALIENHKENLELLKLLTEKISQSTITKLSNGETTEILEAQKIANQDLDIFSKFIELLKEVKGR